MDLYEENEKKMPLKNFGNVPFDIICAQKQVYTRIASVETEQESQDPIPAAPTSTAQEVQQLLEFLQADSDEVAEAAQNWMEEIDSPPDEDVTIEPSAPETDPNALKAALDLLENPNFDNWPVEMRSRVIMDVWHAMARIKVPKEHGMRRQFGIALRDAILIPVPEDRQKIEAYLQTIGKTWDMLRYNSRWLWRHCRRIVPPSKPLAKAVKEVLATFGPLKDAKTGLPLFNAQAWHDAKNLVKAIQLGLLSDPPGVQLYYQMGIDQKSNLPIYHYVQGTNYAEGGIHHSLRARMPKSGAFIQHAACRV
ncbi:hypothetical protein GGX14DRAFT_163855 [Mycena pura]|uniref:Uncharacterized protein n=1 Tax=Mycena pura TaxID=153505 RepID=A0AAD6YM05_9AGAR|nr:hypothetical protein GGX14DRAFT_163855 [Mycena pura]